MKVCSIRTFPRKGESEITIRVTGQESEQLCHAINCMTHKETVGYRDLQRAGLRLLEQLGEINGVFWQTWDCRKVRK